MKTVQEILNSKGKQVWTISGDDIIKEALAMMVDKNIGAIVVTDADNDVRGIISERDFVRFCNKTNATELTAAKISDVMTCRVICVNPNQSIENCMALMTEKKMRHLPVLNEGKLCGLISIGDVVKALHNEKDYLIDQLEHYIAGTL